MATLKEAMKEVEGVYDSPAYADRYTVIMKGSDVYTMSENALAANGVNMYSGNVRDLPGAKDGKRIDKNSLPDEVKQAIKERVEQD